MPGKSHEKQSYREPLWNRFKKHGFVIVAISLDKGSKNRVNVFVRKMGLTYPVLLDPGEKLSNGYKPVGLPTGYFIGRRGKITGKKVGPIDWANQGVASLL